MQWVKGAPLVHESIPAQTPNITIYDGLLNLGFVHNVKLLATEKNKSNLFVTGGYLYVPRNSFQSLYGMYWKMFYVDQFISPVYVEKMFLIKIMIFM